MKVIHHLHVALKCNMQCHVYIIWIRKINVNAGCKSMQNTWGSEYKQNQPDTFFPQTWILTSLPANLNSNSILRLNCNAGTIDTRYKCKDQGIRCHYPDKISRHRSRVKCKWDQSVFSRALSSVRMSLGTEVLWAKC